MSSATTHLIPATEAAMGMWAWDADARDAPKPGRLRVAKHRPVDCLDQPRTTFTEKRAPTPITDAAAPNAERQNACQRRPTRAERGKAHDPRRRVRVPSDTVRAHHLDDRGRSTTHLLRPRIHPLHPRRQPPTGCEAACLNRSPCRTRSTSSAPKGTHAQPPPNCSQKQRANDFSGTQADTTTGRNGPSHDLLRDVRLLGMRSATYASLPHLWAGQMGAHIRLDVHAPVRADHFMTIATVPRKNLIT